MQRVLVLRPIVGLAGSAVLFLVLLPAVVSAHTIAEVVQTPAAFDQQVVSAVGKVANVVTRYGDTPYTVFDLLDADDTGLSVFAWEKPPCKQGDLCHVTGTFVLEKTDGAYVLARGVEAEKVEMVSDAEYKAAGQVIGNKVRYGAGAGW